MFNVRYTIKRTGCTEHRHIAANTPQDVQAAITKARGEGAAEVRVFEEIDVTSRFESNPETPSIRAAILLDALKHTQPMSETFHRVIQQITELREELSTHELDAFLSVLKADPERLFARKRDEAAWLKLTNDLEIEKLNQIGVKNHE